jgi:hypothetical protein
VIVPAGSLRASLHPGNTAGQEVRSPTMLMHTLSRKADQIRLCLRSLGRFLTIDHHDELIWIVPAWG